MANPPDPAHQVEEASLNRALPIAPSMAAAVKAVAGGAGGASVDRRVGAIALVATLIGIAAAFIAQLLSAAIALITNVAFYGTISVAHASPAGNQLAGWAILVPVMGAVIVGLMARYGSAAIRGHGIPEAMEQVLFNESRIPARVLLLKPLSAVISIGTGGPFGAEGPIIATGGALGSLVGQFAKISADERKTLLAAGAAAGMAATFGSPVAAVLLAVELLLFEYRPRSLIPVVLGSVSAAGVRIGFAGMAPAFSVQDLPAPTPSALVGYVIVGAVAGLASVAITKAVYAVEDCFERIPIHWMWWPALGAIPVGIIGFFVPRTMGVGYDNIEQMISGGFTGTALAILCTCKLVSWLFSLGSGTSGGTLAPLFTVGGGLGFGVAAGLAALVPSVGIDMRIGALVGMAALFAGASRAPLASVVFAFEATRQPLGLLPLLGGCGAAYLLSCMMMKTSIMTEKIARRGVHVVSEYETDFLAQVTVAQTASRHVEVLSADEPLVDVRQMLEDVGGLVPHTGFPVVDSGGSLIGVVTRTEIMAGEARGAVRNRIRRQPVVTFPDSSLREAADRMTVENIGRLVVVDRVNPTRMIGILTRSDLLRAHATRLHAKIPHK